MLARGIGDAKSSLGVAQDEIDNLLDLRNSGPGIFCLSRAIQERTIGFEKDFTKGSADRVDSLSANPATFQADDVQSAENSMVTGRHAIRNDVCVDAGDATNHSSTANAAVLLDRGKTAEDNALADFDMARKSCVVGKIGIIPDDTIVTDVTVCHEVAIVADTGHAATTATSAAHRDAFANDTVRTDDQACFVEVIVPYLTFSAQNGLRMYHGPRADLRAAGDDNMG